MTETQAQPYYNGMDDNNYQKSYGNDNYKSQKDSSSKSIDIKKINCINTNLNINGNNAGNISIGNKDADKGYLGAFSSGGGYDGYKKDKGFTCIINNNNTNVNTVDGNATELSACEECFSANSTLQTVIEDFLVNRTAPIVFDIDVDELTIPGNIDTIEQLCSLLEGHIDVLVVFAITFIVEQQTGSFTGNEAAIDALVECLLEAGVIVEATV